MSAPDTPTPTDSTAAPKRRATPTPTRTLAEHAVEAIIEKKGQDIVVLDVRAVSGAADVFVIATGDSDLQIKAIVQGVRARVKEELGERSWHVEGNDYWQWVLVDYVDVVVHVFNREKRAHYDLERLWGDAPVHEVADDGEAVALAFLDAAPRAPRTDGDEPSTDSAVPNAGPSAPPTDDDATA